MNAAEAILAKTQLTTHPEVIKAVANFAHGNLLAISRARLANQRKHGDPDHVNVDTFEDRSEGDEQRQIEHSEEVGHKPALTLTQRADQFATMAAWCLKYAADHGWKEFNAPQTFEAYLGASITRMREADTTGAMLPAMRGISREQAIEMQKQAMREQAMELEGNRADLMAMQSDYEIGEDITDTLDEMGSVAQHRLRVKVIDSLMYRAERNAKQIFKTNGRGALAENLLAEREILFGDCLELQAELEEFEKTRRVKIDGELLGTNRTLTTISTTHQNQLTLYKRQMKEEAEAAVRLKQQRAA